MFKKVPHTYVIIFFIIVIAAIFTWITPGGEYVEVQKMVDGVEITEVVFQEVEHEAQSWQIFSALFNGFEKQAGIIIFILMIGGAFWIMNDSKAIDVGIFAFLRLTKKLEKIKFIRMIGVDNIVITLIMLLFSAFGAIFGMSEETIAFIIILVPLALSMGYDSITGVAMVFVAAGIGFAGAILNPFTIGIAQGLAGIPLFSGIEYRMYCWVVLNIVGIGYVLRYAAKIRKDPTRSSVYKEDDYWRKRGDADMEKIEYHTPVSAWITFGLVLSVLVAFSFVYPSTRIKIGNPDSAMISASIDNSISKKHEFKELSADDIVNATLIVSPLKQPSLIAELPVGEVKLGDSTSFNFKTLINDELLLNIDSISNKKEISIMLADGIKSDIGVYNINDFDSLVYKLEVSKVDGKSEILKLKTTGANDNVTLNISVAPSGSGSAKNLPAIPILAGLFLVFGILSLRKSVHFFVLLLLIYTMLFLIVGVMGYEWYVMEIATLFLGMGIASGIAMRNSADKIVRLFLDGVKDIMSAAIIVGLAGGIIVILEDGKIIGSILHSLSQSMNGLGEIASVSIMYGIQNIINIVIPSGSAKAALTMPIMAPFSDLIGISRQATVMAFQFGDGFTNMITPTSGVLIAVLGVGRIPYQKWVKWITPLMIVLLLLGLLLLIPTVTMDLSGF